MARRAPVPRDRSGEGWWPHAFATLAVVGTLTGASAVAAFAQGVERQEVEASEPATALVPGPTALIDARLRPAPDEFDSTDQAVWDGRRTLQGIWIAHPLADTARRVRIMNLDTGFAVDGALFRRDGGTEGPEVLVSSDAAMTLGMNPNEPAQLAIVAIRRGPVAAAAAEAANEETDGPSAVTPDDAEATESAVAITAELEPEEEPAPQTASAEGPDEPPDEAEAVPDPVLTETAPAVAVPEPAPAEVTTEAAPAEDNILPVLAALEAEAVEQSEPQAEAAEEGLLAAPAPRSRPIAPVDVDTPTAALAATAPAAAPGTTLAEDWPLAADPEPGAVTAPSAEDPAEPEPAPTETAAIPTADPEPASAATPVEQTQAPPRLAFIQSGIFGVEENARRLIQKLRDAGFESEGKPVRSGERTLTRVVSGPFASQAELDRALAEIRRIGPKDAVPVRR